MRGRVRFAAGLGVVLLAACADGGTPPAGPGPSAAPAVPVAGRGWVSCAALAAPVPPADAGPPLAADFVPVAVTLCRQGERRRPGGGTDAVERELRSTEVAALVAALRLPDAEPSGGACTADLVLPPFLVLHDAAGRWVRPAVPVDGCAKPRPEVVAALGALPLTTVAERVLHPLTSDAAAAAGCGDVHADMVSVAVAGGGSLRRLERTPAEPGELRVCRYEVPPAERGTGKPAGTFLGGGVLPAPRAAAVAARLARLGPARPCAAHAGRFALLTPAAGGPAVYVELDGCRRVMADQPAGPPAFAQADETLIGLLDG
ncbi:hypothetical protein [Spirilliplanes yamanashiensis]|uniref:Lipoprotein n=1 Tax=Spirilliplanes yamanashiensis TaxID=42233 RepID=A0A8J3YEA4_9ACTN|nr:hypothetical protein [Spirilliplanes yamanashiensis]MDP9816586.1 hypothetical protein [Spirilliplanes yamanashiensis]GIJ06113.1 hypothetical protein Sya03_54650 [Spirilliplanes yamanashiensis]